MHQPVRYLARLRRPAYKIEVVGGFEWDSDRERSNLEKHGIDFTEAALVFAEPLVRDEGQEAKILD